ncbi:MAG: hypothetical protein K2Q34_06065 [Alphaproteobacteria bacterium]|nr:hypothetical protein [Alphaproteobacteria bacterium]
MSFSTIKSALSIVLLSSTLFVSGQLYATEAIAPSAPITTNPNVSHDAAPAKPSKKRKNRHHKHKKHHKKHKKHKGHKHSGSALSPEQQAVKTVENCKKLLAAPVPENEGPKKAKKRRRCEDLISKEGIAITAADAAIDPVVKTSVVGGNNQSAAVPAPETAPAEASSASEVQATEEAPAT